MNLSGRGLYIVTGANTGIGRVIAAELASRQARVLLACRSLQKAEPVAAELRRSSGNEHVACAQLDLSSLASVRSFANSLGDQPLACLLNNAGCMSSRHEVTADGFENTWAVNALAPWLLTQLLLPGLTRGRGRVVNVGSRLEKTGDLSPLRAEQDALRRFLDSAASYNTFKAYGTSKAALTAWTLSLARRLEGSGVSAHLCTPGMVNTELSRFAHPALLVITAPLRWALLRSPAEGADTPAWLAYADEAELGVTGGYWYNRARIEASEAAVAASADGALWRTLELQAASVGGPGAE